MGPTPILTGPLQEEIRTQTTHRLRGDNVASRWPGILRAKKRSLRRNQMSWYHDLGPLASRTVRQWISTVQTMQPVVFCCDSHHKLIHLHLGKKQIYLLSRSWMISCMCSGRGEGEASIKRKLCISLPVWPPTPGSTGKGQTSQAAGSLMSDRTVCSSPLTSSLCHLGQVPWLHVVKREYFLPFRIVERVSVLTSASRVAWEKQ